jgi:hypothetical protein
VISNSWITRLQNNLIALYLSTTVNFHLVLSKLELELNKLYSNRTSLFKSTHFDNSIEKDLLIEIAK